MLKIKDLRQEKGWTQKNLAERINSSNKNIWAWENGVSSPDIETLILLSKVFDVSVDYLIGNTDELGNVTAQVPAESLTHNEKELLKAFRTLGVFEQGGIIAQVKAFAENMQSIKK